MLLTWIIWFMCLLPGIDREAVRQYRGTFSFLDTLLGSEQPNIRADRPTNSVVHPMNNEIKCRFCGGPLAEFVDLGMSPLCESYVARDQFKSRGTFSPSAAL